MAGTTSLRRPLRSCGQAAMRWPCRAGYPALRRPALPWLGLLAALVIGGGRVPAADPFAGADPAWSLLHEPAVAHELALTPPQGRQFRALLDELDARCFPLRNRPTAEAVEGAAAITAEATTRLETILSGPQFRRFTEIQTRQQGTAALLKPGMAKLMHYKPQQHERLETLIAETAAATRALERRLRDGEPRAPLDRAFSDLQRDELRQVLDLLTPTQQAVWRRQVGRDFDLSTLGRPVFKAPELVDSGAWLNSAPLTLASLGGKVVVVHFYAFGCVNCSNNYPTYLDWQDRFRDKDVVLIGIHTPETDAERSAAAVRTKATDAGFAFPVLIDGTQANWNAWGNSMWPSVYLVDKRGYLRHFWPGELKWQGATGDQWMRERIEELLAEPASGDPRPGRPAGRAE